MDHGGNCFPFLTSLFSHKRLRQGGALAGDICLYEILQHAPVSWHAWARRCHVALDLLSLLGTSDNFLHVRTYWALGAIFYTFFSWRWSKLVLLLSVEWFSLVTSAFDTKGTSKNGTWKKGQSAGKQLGFLKNKPFGSFVVTGFTVTLLCIGLACYKMELSMYF